MFLKFSGNSSEENLKLLSDVFGDGMSSGPFSKTGHWNRDAKQDFISIHHFFRRGEYETRSEN